jgi:hypothetical protein
MKYLKTFNESLFMLSNNQEIAQKIYEWLTTNDYIITETDNYMVVKDIKLDKNNGTYNLMVDNNSIQLEYYKNNQLKFKFDLEDIEPVTRVSIKNFLRKKLKFQTIQKGVDVNNYGNPIDWQKETRKDREI